MAHEGREEKETHKDQEQQESGNEIPDLERQRKDRRERQGREQGVGLALELLGLAHTVAGVEPLRGAQPHPHQRHGHDARDRRSREVPGCPEDFGQARYLPNEESEHHIREDQGKAHQPLPPRLRSRAREHTFLRHALECGVYGTHGCGRDAALHSKRSSRLPTALPVFHEEILKGGSGNGISQVAHFSTQVGVPQIRKT